MNNDATEYTVVDSLITVNSNTTDTIGFRYGALDLANELQILQPNQPAVYVDYSVVSDSDFKPEAAEATGLTLTFYMLRGRRKGGEVWFERSLPAGKQARFSLRKLKSPRPKIFVNQSYRTWSRIRFTQSFPTGRLLTDVVTLKLLEAGALPLHGGAVAQDGQAAVLMGPPDIGKTFTTMSLTQRGYSFLAEDLCVVRDGSVHGAPYTETLGKRDPNLSWIERTRDQITEVLWKGNPRKRSVFEELGLSPSRVDARAGLSRIYLLDRGEAGVERLSDEEAFRELRGINGLEFEYARNTTLLWYLYLNDETRSVERVREQERRLLAGLTRKTPVFRVCAPDPAAYGEMIAEHFNV